MRLSLVLLFCIVFRLASAEYTAHCQQNVVKARSVLAESTFHLLNEAHESRSRRMHNVFVQVAEKKVKDSDPPKCTPPVCPSPQPTIFPPPPTLLPTTPPAPTTTPYTGTTTAQATTTASTGPTVTSDTSPTVTSTDTTATSSTGVPPMSGPKETIRIPKTLEESIAQTRSYFFGDLENDPFTLWTRAMDFYLNPENGVCEDKPKFESLNSITEGQLFGTFAQLATVHTGPFCNLCNRMMTEVYDKVLKPHPLLMTTEEQFFGGMIKEFLPEPAQLCTAIAPGCHSKFQSRAAHNITGAVVCLECTACQTVLQALFHKFLLDDALVAHVGKFLHETVFYNMCAELCPLNEFFTAISGTCFTMESCQGFFDATYKRIIRVMKNILKAERFCVLEIGWCELGEVPNIVHCLRELCQEELGDSPGAQYVCSLIPDRPEEADAFLNVQETKKYKKMKDYHFDYMNKHGIRANTGKDEL